MLSFWRKKRAIGVGLGVGVLGAMALAARHALRSSPRQPIPENISPIIFSTRVAQTAHGEMIYHVCGDGAPMLFLHGVYPGASSFEWSKVYPRFTSDATVIAPDLLGFGESERPRPGLDADQHVQSLADALRDILPGLPVIVIASGFGAALAAKLAAQHPELVRSLVLLAPEGLDPGNPRVPKGISRLVKIPGVNSFFYRHAMSRPQFVRDWLLRFGFKHAYDIPADDLEVMSTLAGQYGAEYAIFAFLRGRSRYDASRQLPRINQPTTLLWPQDDKGFPSSIAARVEAEIPYCRVIEDPDFCALAALSAPDVVESLARAALGPTPLHKIEISS